MSLAEFLQPKLVLLKALADSKDAEEFANHYSALARSEVSVVSMNGRSTTVPQAVASLRDQGPKSEVAKAAGPLLAAIYEKAVKFQRAAGCNTACRELMIMYWNGCTPINAAGEIDIEDFKPDFVAFVLEQAAMQFRKI